MYLRQENCAAEVDGRIWGSTFEYEIIGVLNPAEELNSDGLYAALDRFPGNSGLGWWRNKRICLDAREEDGHLTTWARLLFLCTVIWAVELYRVPSRQPSMCSESRVRSYDEYAEGSEWLRAGCQGGTLEERGPGTRRRHLIWGSCSKS